MEHLTFNYQYIVKDRCLNTTNIEPKFHSKTLGNDVEYK